MKIFTLKNSELFYINNIFFKILLILSPKVCKAHFFYL